MLLPVKQFWTFDCPYPACSGGDGGQWQGRGRGSDSPPQQSHLPLGKLPTPAVKELGIQNALVQLLHIFTDHTLGDRFCSEGKQEKVTLNEICK